MTNIRPSWFSECNFNWLHNFCANVLKTGEMPKHVAFIMDGNRRFARKHNMEKVAGHVEGFVKLSETLQWCQRLGITEVTVFAFSIENFKRSKDEVDGLMDLVRKRLQLLFEEKDKLMQNGVCIRVLGNLSLLPTDIQKSIGEVVLLSRYNKKAFLNVCVSYTSREEMCHAVKEMAIGAKKGLIEPEDISEEVLEKCLYSSGCSQLDLIVRTSGEVRLSDFLLWQSAYSVLAFVDVLWPEFTIWHLFSAIFYYQMNYKKPQECQLEAMKEAQLLQDDVDRRRALETVKSKNQNEEITEMDILEEVENHRKQREKRIERFADYLENKRVKMFEELYLKLSAVTAL